VLPTTPQPPAAQAFKVFLSHSMHDGLHVEQVQRQLEALGMKVWLAEHDPRPGKSILAKVEGALRDCDAVVFLITTNSIDSAYVQQEVGLARAHGKLLVPLVDKRVDTSRLGMLRELEWLEIDLDNPSQAFANVTKSLQPLLLAQLASTTSSLPGQPSQQPMDATMTFLLGALCVVIGVVLSCLILQLRAASA
jgi:nucleoside 2-deoxyribosyltransferase